VSERTIFTEAQAERELRSLELFGMRFGLERMRRMMTALGSPEQRFRAIHVLGTNGKSSTTRMTAAILERHGLRTAAYLSPHLVSYRERLLIDGRELDADAFAAAIDRATWAAARVNRTLAEDDHVTQFELLTAAALWQIARAEVDVAVVEAGLGGRYDATSVIEPRVTALTNVGLEHTRWLGPTVTDIAEEKLAAVRAHTTLVLPPAGTGPDSLDPAALAVAERVAGERDVRIVHASLAGTPARLLARGAFQRRNFALARAAAEAYLQDIGVVLDERALAAAAAETQVAGRLQLLAGDTPTLLDSAHNPDAVRALVESLAQVLPVRATGGTAPIALVLGVLDDKDAASMLATLMPHVARAWFTAPPSSRALSPAALLSLARQLGFQDTVCEPNPWRALEQARRWAGEHDGAVLATGSVYLVGELLARLAACSREAQDAGERDETAVARSVAK
jgi:dihydrofolate synthase/folylpolyglutamate synthase